MNVLEAIEKFEEAIQKAKKRARVESLERLRDEMSEEGIEMLECFFEVFSTQINSYSQEAFLEEMKDVRHALGNIDPDGNVEWVSENKMIELSEEYDMEDYFSNNAAIIMECSNYKNCKVWFICLIKR